MTTGTVKTQGTELFLADTVSSSVAAVLKFKCPTAISGIGGGAKDQIEQTCLDTVDDKEFVGGLGNPTAISIPFNFIPEENNRSHQVLFELKRTGDNVNWLVGLSNGNDVPTLDTDDEFVFPADRTAVKFTGYVSEVLIDISTNELVRGTLSIQRSGSEVWNFLTA